MSSKPLKIKDFALYPFLIIRLITLSSCKRLCSNSRVSLLLIGLITLSSCATISHTESQNPPLSITDHHSQDLILLGRNDKTRPHVSKRGLFLAAEVARRDFNLEVACAKYLEIIKLENNRPPTIISERAFPVLLACGMIDDALLLTQNNPNQKIHPLSQIATVAEAIINNEDQIVTDKQFAKENLIQPLSDKQISENIFLNFYAFYWSLEHFRKKYPKINTKIPQTDIYNSDDNSFNNQLLKKIKNLSNKRRNIIIVTNKLQSGLIHAYKQDYEKALKDWEELYKLRDSFLISREIASELAQVIYLMAHAYSLNGENDKAKSIISSYQYQDPILKRIMVILEEGDSLPNVFNEPIDNLSRTLLFLYSLSKDYEQINSLAILSLGNYVSRGAMKDLYNFEKSKMLLLQNRLGEALEFMDKLPKGSDIYLDSIGIKVEIIFRLGDIDKATSLLMSLAQEGQNSRKFLLHAADIFRRGERYQDAIKIYNQLIERLDNEPSKDEWLYFYNRGIAHERSGNWTAAERDMIKAIEINPDEPNVLNYVAYVWVDKKIHLQKGTQMIQKALSIDPDNPAIIDSLGWAYYRLKEYDKAIKYLERAVQYLPLDPTVNDHLGDAYWKVGRVNEAFYQWRRALQMSPDEEHAPQLLIKSVNGLPE